MILLQTVMVSPGTHLVKNRVSQSMEKASISKQIHSTNSLNIGLKRLKPIMPCLLSREQIDWVGQQ